MADPAKQVDPGMLMLIGEAHFANGDLKQASTAFEKAAQTKGQQPLAQTRLAQIAMASGDVEGGVRKLEGLATEEGAPAQTDMALLTGYLRQGNTGKALEVARGMVKKSPNDPMAHQALGSVLVLRKELPGGARRVREGARTQRHLHARGGEPGPTRSAGRQDRRGARALRGGAGQGSEERGRPDGARGRDGAREGAVRGDRGRPAAGDRRPARRSVRRGWR